MREVAARAGVSGKTVSRVINGDRYVSADVRHRVEQAIADLDYVPNMLSQVFRSGRDTAIGLAVPDIADGFFAAVIQAVETVARARGTAVLVTSLGHDPAGERPAVEALLRRSIAGLVIAPVSGDHVYLRPWLTTTRLVFVDRPPQQLTADSVVEDDIGGAEEAVRHLVERGHRRIAFLGNADAVVTTQRRLLGYRQALTGAGIEPDPGLEFLYAGDPAGAAPALLARLSTGEVTAVFSSNSHASTVLVPRLPRSTRDALGFVSFGDFPMADALQPSVTVVRQDPSAVGHLAARRLFQQIDSGADGIGEALVRPVSLLVRQSTRAIRPPTPPVPSTRTTQREKTSMTEFEGRTILVTGASGGIGGATVRQLVAKGADVIAAGQSEEALAALTAETGARPLPFDVTSEDSVRAAVDGLDLWGVVNCHGYGGEIASPQDTDIDVFDKVISINARGALLVIKYAARTLIRLGQGGSIVNVSSQASLVALTSHVSYGSSKAALDNITRVSALELGRYGIRVNSVNPTVVMTDMSNFYWGRPEIGGPFLEQMPLGRWATEDDVAGPIVFLLSDAAAMISGVSLPIDGGYTNR